MNVALVIITAIATLVGGGGGVWGVVTVRATRGKIMAESAQLKATADETIADTVRVLIGGASELIEPLKRELAEARQEARQARADLAAVRRSSSILDTRLHELIDLIHTPNMDIARLRELVPNNNGNVRST